MCNSNWKNFSLNNVTAKNSGACMGNGTDTVDGFTAAFGLKKAFSCTSSLSLGFHKA
jgi:hypothetical protein